MKRRLLAAALLMMMPATASSESVFSAFGYGRWTSTIDARTGGMGDVTVVSRSRWGLTARNPATIARLRETVGHISLFGDYTRIDTGDTAETRPDGRLGLIAVGVPLGTVMRTGIRTASAASSQ